MPDTRTAATGPSATPPGFAPPGRGVVDRLERRAAAADREPAEATDRMWRSRAGIAAQAAHRLALRPMGGAA